MSLLKQIENAVKNGKLNKIFTTQDIKVWIDKNKIKKDDGSDYSESTIGSQLSTCFENSSSTRSDKGLNRTKNKDGKFEYFF